MTEAYNPKHIYAVTTEWALQEGTPHEVATEYVRRWNSRLQGELPYPETPQFIGALAKLIRKKRAGEVIIPLSDNYIELANCSPADPLCQACRICEDMWY